MNFVAKKKIGCNVYVVAKEKIGSNVYFFAKEKIGFINVNFVVKTSGTGSKFKDDRYCIELASDFTKKMELSEFDNFSEEFKLKIYLFDIEIGLISRSPECRKFCAMVYFWNFSKQYHETF